jgi:hypothetical protein
MIVVFGFVSLHRLETNLNYLKTNLTNKNVTLNTNPSNLSSRPIGAIRSFNAADLFSKKYIDIIAFCSSVNTVCFRFSVFSLTRVPAVIDSKIEINLIIQDYFLTKFSLQKSKTTTMLRSLTDEIWGVSARNRLSVNIDPNARFNLSVYTSQE